jgi:hypothetical protein
VELAGSQDKWARFVSPSSPKASPDACITHWKLKSSPNDSSTVQTFKVATIG